MNGTHPEPAEIAALGVGLLEPDEASAVREHLADCGSCAQIRDDLNALSGALAETPSPPIPDDVAARIDAALAAEAHRTPTTESTSESGPGSSLGSFHVKRRRWPTMALAAAGAIVAIGLGGSLIQTLDPGADSSAERNGAEDAAGESVEGELNAAESTLEQRVRDLLVSIDGSPGTASEGSGESSQPETEASATLPGCVRAAIDRTGRPLAADRVDFEGEPAYLAVFSHTADPQRVDAYVIDAVCVDRNLPASGEILVQASYPRD